MDQRVAKMGKAFSVEFRNKIVQLHLDQGKTIKWLAEEYGISASTVSRWIIVYRNKAHMNTEKLSKGVPFDSFPNNKIISDFHCISQ